MGQKQRLDSIVKEVTLDDFLAHPEDIQYEQEHVPDVALWEEHEYPGNKWGMAIDIHSCTGCSACVVACYAENNIPVVGKEQVINGREMSWIRIDRYYKGDPHEPYIVHQPMNCTHCEMAPCESVCPVAATVHSAEGLNTMVYNRCVGTRYCSNNCPFKVRRFNYFHYNKNLSETRKLQFNPEVTVRSRGVMEKCTYCVQRIEKVKIEAKNERRPIKDGEITPACAQACPTKAITFGDLNHQDNQITKKHNNARAYHLLPGLRLKTRTAFMAKVRNPNPKLAKKQKHESTKHA
jgi:molybdopterin-containing oxidoreductase family iron-sulfur binding subunit